MYYYENKVPNKNEMNVCKLLKSEETDECIYVTLPEYNNIKGIIHKKDLPAKIKYRRRILAKIRQAGYVVCTVTKSINLKSTNENSIIELSTRGIDNTLSDKVLLRQKNYERIIKLIKYVSIAFNLNYEDIIQYFHKEDIVPLTEISKDENIDVKQDLYTSYLEDIDLFVSKMNLDDNIETNVKKQLRSMITEINSSSTLEFELAVWKSKKDAIYVLRELFTFLIDEHKYNIKLIGPPKYIIYLPAVETNNIDKKYEYIKTLIIQWMKDNNVSGYGLNLNPNNKNIKKGDIVISYPIKVDV